MELPAKLIGASAEESRIYLFKGDCPVGIADHMHVCIKRNGQVLIFSTCSSQISTSIRLAQIRGWNINTYPVMAPDNDNHFTAPTYINCNEVWQMSEEEFGRLYAEGKISDTKGSGFINETGMRLISNGIKLSTQITDDVKELFK